ncbi:hypothetical protein FACS1894186_2080 [Alphaproteobacteria bacterium]|nr:hypothetical protein FACS1894186_2080 [Alphaproteobacteria bacterium]
MANILSSGMKALSGLVSGARARDQACDERFDQMVREHGSYAQAVIAARPEMAAEFAKVSRNPAIMFDPDLAAPIVDYFKSPAARPAMLAEAFLRQKLDPVLARADVRAEDDDAEKVRQLEITRHRIAADKDLTANLTERETLLAQYGSADKLPEDEQLKYAEASLAVEALSESQAREVAEQKKAFAAVHGEQLEKVEKAKWNDAFFAGLMQPNGL